MELRLTPNKMVSFRTRGLSMLQHRIAEATDTNNPWVLNGEDLVAYVVAHTRLRVESVMMHMGFMEPEYGLNSILDEYVKRMVG